METIEQALGCESLDPERRELLHQRLTKLRNLSELPIGELGKLRPRDLKAMLSSVRSDAERLKNTLLSHTGDKVGFAENAALPAILDEMLPPDRRSEVTASLDWLIDYLSTCERVFSYDAGGHSANIFLDFIIWKLAAVYKDYTGKPPKLSDSGPFMRFVLGWAELYQLTDLTSKSPGTRRKFISGSLKRGPT